MVHPQAKRPTPAALFIRAYTLPWGLLRCVAWAVGDDSKLNVSTLMAAPVEDLDAEAVKQGLAQ